ncbi:hypothetical protein NN561_013402 [Cricetulus griseus]
MSAPSSCWTPWSSGSGSSWTPSPPARRCCGSWAAGVRSRLAAGSVPTPGWAWGGGVCPLSTLPKARPQPQRRRVCKSIPTALHLTSFDLGEVLEKVRYCRDAKWPCPCRA